MLTETWQIITLIVCLSAPWIILAYAIHGTENWVYEMEHPNTKRNRKNKKRTSRRK